jgi:hypothetical protein
MKDFVGFTRKMAHSEAIRLPTFRSCREIMDNLFQEHGGRIFNTGEDPVLAGFQPAQQVWDERNMQVIEPCDEAI